MGWALHGLLLHGMLNFSSHIYSSHFGEVTIGILKTMWDKKIRSIQFIEGRNYKFVRSTITLEKCPLHDYM